MTYKNALVTGAGRGIGRAIALALAKEGVNTVVCARSLDALEKTAELCRAHGVKSVALKADLSSAAAVRDAADAAIEALGGIDILVNCAGVCPTDGIENVTEEEWDTVMDTNFKGVFFLSQRILAHMKEKGDGYIVNINSTVALGAKPGVAVYSASKYGLEGITAALYQDAKRHGIRVSSIYPGVTDTEMLRAQADTMPSPPEHWMKPEDIAYCVMFLVKSSPRMVVRDIVPWAQKYDEI